MYIAGGKDSSGNILDSFTMYNLEKNTFDSLPKMNENRENFSLLKIDNYLYATGGNSYKKQSLRSVERYNIDTKKWESVMEMLISRKSHTSIVKKNQIFVIGGYDGDKYLCSVERYIPIFHFILNRYDTSSNMWMQMKFMYESRASHSSALYKENGAWKYVFLFVVIV